MSATGTASGAALSPAWRNTALALVLLAAAMRVNNAIRYKTRLGFDAVENVDYIERLLTSWALPAPDAAWATSHPPLFYYLSAAVGRCLALFSAEQLLLIAIPLGCGVASIAMACMAALLVRRLDPTDERRTVIALGLVLFLPVHVYMSAMVNEELLAALLVSGVLLGALLARPATRTAPGLRTAGVLGVLAGLALLTKLSGVLVLAAVSGAWLLQGWRRGESGPEIRRVLVLCVAAALVGGWFYARNQALYGFFYPQDLETHSLMFAMPPGERGPLDYLYVPLATWTDPQLLSPDLLRSVWGSTYATAYFDGHRHFLANSVAAKRMGTLLLTLGLLPCLAFATGALRGPARARRDALAPDALLLGLLAITLGGYVIFTWGNPWFATLKSSYLLGLSLPFAWYASEVLARWTRLPGPWGRMTWVTLGALVVLVTVTFTIGPVFDKIDGAGLPWRDLAVTP